MLSCFIFLTIEVIEILAPNPNGDANAIVRLRRFSTDENGVAQTEPESYKLEINNLIQESQNDPELAALMTSLMSYIAKVGIAQGFIASPQGNN